MPHQRAFQVRIGVVFAGLMMAVVEARRRELLQPDLKVVDQPVLPVVDVDAAVMCIADTSTIPSFTPLLFTIAATSSVIRTNSCRAGVVNQRYSVSVFIIGPSRLVSSVSF